MRLVWRFFRWLSSNLGGAIALTGHVLILREDCPHCGKRTLCEISTLHGHARCLGCGQKVHEREGGVGRETDEDSPDDLAQEERSQKKDSRKEVSREEVSREEDEETLVTT
jgi:transcription elongation factor Elf1